jgi:hypothetical protein
MNSYKDFEKKTIKELHDKFVEKAPAAWWIDTLDEKAKRYGYLDGLEKWLNQKLKESAKKAIEAVKIKNGHNSEAAEADEGYTDAIEEQQQNIKDYFNNK